MKNGKDKKDTNNGNAKNKWNLPHNRWHKRNKKLPDQLIESRSDSELNQIVKIPSASERNKNDKFNTSIPWMRIF